MKEKMRRYKYAISGIKKWDISADKQLYVNMFEKLD